jgi:hypothetical protein
MLRYICYRCPGLSEAKSGSEITATAPVFRFAPCALRAEGDAIVAKKNPHIGSSFESWLDKAGIREEVTAAAIKAVIARQLAQEMKKRKITKKRMVELEGARRGKVQRASR